MNRFFTLLTLALLISCFNQSKIEGLWQSTGDSGTLEFKTSGEVMVVDNMSAIMVGRFEVEEDGLMSLEFTGSDILRDSVQPTSPILMKVHFTVEGDELSLRFNGEGETETYRRVR